MCGSRLGERAQDIGTRQLEIVNLPEEKVERGKLDNSPVEKVLLFQFEGQFQSLLVKLPIGKTILLGRASTREGTFIYDELIDLTEYGAFAGGVSRQHALLGRTEDGVQLVDLGSRNGTFINGRKLVGFEPYDLADSEVLHLGYLKIRLTIERRFPTS